MYIYEKYALIKSNGHLNEIEAAIAKTKGKTEASFEDFLPH